MMMKINLLMVLLFLSIIGTSQFHGRKNIPLIELNGKYSMSGWFVSPGITYMWPNKIKSLGYNENTDTISRIPRGRIGLYLEVGRYHIFPEGGNIFNYMDYSLAYKRLSGSEKLTDDKPIFKQNYLLANFNINNIIQISDNSFIQNSLGANLDFKLWEHGDPSPNNTKGPLFSLHYKIGYGIKLSQKLFIIPSLETPIINITQWDQGRSTYNIYYNRYRPIILSCRIILLRTPPRGECPPVYANPDDKAKQDSYLMGQ